MEEQKNIEESTAQADDQSPKIPVWKRVTDHFSMDLFIKNVPFMLFIAVLAVIYITNNSRAAALVRELDTTNKELKELKWEYLDIQSRLIYATSESQLLQESAKQGLQPLDKPAFEIRNTITIKEKE